MLFTGNRDCPNGEEEICSTQCGVPDITRTNLKKAGMSGKIAGGVEVLVVSDTLAVCVVNWWHS